MNSMRHRYLLVIALSAAVGASASRLNMMAAVPAQASQTATAPNAAAGANPFFAESALPFQAPPFDKIKESDYQPALEEGMQRQLAEVLAIANCSDAPTFANTIEAMENTGALLTRVSKVCFGLAQANTNPTIQKI